MITKQERRYQRGITATIMILVVLTLSPFVLLLMSSISSESSLIRNGYQFWPQTFSLDAYKYILRNSDTILKAYGLTIATTAVGTLMSLFLTITLAYPLSRKSLKGRNVITFLIFWTNALYFVSDSKLWSLQILLQNILNNVQFLSKNSQVTSQIGMSVTNIPSVSVRMAIAVLGVLPILILFPFFQKYIVKGISLGAVKE